jgi:hypothetical protein
MKQSLTTNLSRYDGNKADWVTEDVVPDPNPLPEIPGWSVLIRPVEPPKKVGSIIIVDSFQEDLQYLNNIGRVLKIGELAYTDPDTSPKDGAWFPHGKYRKPWCKVGDYVVWGKHQGAKVMVQNVALVLLNDDLVLFKVDDPKDINPMFNTAKYSNA